MVSQVLLCLAFDKEKDNCSRRLKMKMKNLLLALAYSWGYCDGQTNQNTQLQGIDMHHTIENQKKKFFIGLEL